MRKIPLSCIVVGTTSILLSFIGIFFSLDGFGGWNLPFKALICSLYGGLLAIPKLGYCINILRLPLFDYYFSIVLVASGIGTIFLKPWGRRFAYIYAISLISISVIALPIVLAGFAIEFRTIERYGFLQGLIFGGAVVYIVAFLCALFYPITLLFFFSRPKIKEKFKR